MLREICSNTFNPQRKEATSPHTAHRLRNTRLGGFSVYVSLATLVIH